MHRSGLVPFPIAWLLVAAAALPAAAADTWTDPHPGMRQLHRTTSAPQRIWALEIDLCAPGVDVRATRASESPRVTSAWAWSQSAQAAVNGDFYSGSYTPIGLAIGGGERWPGTTDSASHGFVAFGAELAVISFPEEVVSPIPDAYREAVGGNVTLVEAGVPRLGDTGSFCTTRHPRTMVGLTEDRRTLYLAVVDGRSSASVGMTCDEMANFMLELGAWDALNLDGGGSTTMYVRGTGVLNDPSDGSERTVANHLGVFATGGGPAPLCPPAPPAPEPDAAPPPPGPDEVDAGSPPPAGDAGASDVDGGDMTGGCRAAPAGRERHTGASTILALGCAVAAAYRRRG